MCTGTHEIPSEDLNPIKRCIIRLAIILIPGLHPCNVMQIGLIAFPLAIHPRGHLHLHFVLEEGAPALEFQALERTVVEQHALVFQEPHLDWKYVVIGRT